ncbi:MAG: thioredoxin family protein [Candidatus Nanohaloarchaea archaeon]|nr:thioredoxin family protein [Candidatus Nanohaloarchaea archaeon]
MTTVKMLKTPGCKSCERSREVIKSLQDEFDFVFEEIDLTERPELAQEYQVMAAPGIVIDGELVFQGGVSEQELRDELEADA